MTGFPSARKAELCSLLFPAAWLICCLSIALLLSSARHWAMPGSEARELGRPFPIGDISSTSATTADNVLKSQPAPAFHPWFGILENPGKASPLPDDTIEISQRKLHLIGISTSTAPDESFALIRAETGEIKPLRTGETAEPGVELVELRPNAVILKAGNRWEKLYIGDPPSGAFSSATAQTPIRSHVAAESALGDSMESSAGIKHSAQPHRNGNPNLANRTIRKRLGAMMATLQQ